MSWINLTNCLYPVGSLYFSVDSNSPANTVGGTWVKIKDALIGASGDTDNFAMAMNYGGSFMINENQIPQHKHEMHRDSNGNLTYAWGSTIAHDTDSGGNISGSGYKYACISSNYSIWSAQYTGYNAEGGAEDFIPYHFTCHIWYRVS